MDGQPAASESHGTSASPEARGPRPPGVVVLVLGSAIDQIRHRLEGAEAISLVGCPEPARAGAAAAQCLATVVVIPARDGDGDARALVRALQADPTTAEVPVVVLGGSGHPGERRRAFAAGAAEHWWELPERTELLARLETLSRVAQAGRARDAAQAEVESLRRQLAHAQPATGGGLDPETALPDRGRLDELVEAEWRRARRSGGWLSVVMIEVEQVPAESPSADTEVRQVLGQVPAETRPADTARRLATALRGALRRGGDVLGRWEHHRYVALLPEVSQDGAATVARALVRAARGAGVAQGLRVGGASARPREAAGGADGLLAGAESALRDPARVD